MEYGVRLQDYFFGTGFWIGIGVEAYVSRVRGPHTHKEKQKKRDGRSEVNRRLEYYYFAQCRDKDYVVVNL